ncbi:MAG: LD-carboxypeptidase [Cyanobacteria bacterium SBC]|nr:LD-carboxypeptidase [Cyanobacteria bacterium SBC]
MTTRRNFTKLLTAAIGTLAVATDVRRVRAVSGVRKPKRLFAGATVGIINPASATFVRDDVDLVLDAMRGLGLVPKLGNHTRDRYGYFAGRDRDRAADINQFFADPEVVAILPIEGGWGSSRVLPYLDYNLIRQNPKILVGFSDITALLLGIYSQTNLITFHGPNGFTSWSPAQTDWFRRVLFDGEAMTFRNFRDPADNSRPMQTRYRWQTITSGTARGRLFGGNLSVLSAIVGSPYVPNLDGGILFLEDVGEDIYRIDRMMTHLKLAGLFDRLSGFVFGQCTRCDPGEGYGSLTLEEVVWDQIEPLGIPAWYGATIGHLEPIVTLPIGIEVELNADMGTIQILEAAVV